MRYRLHPDLCDLYVEGDTDKGFLQWFLDANARKVVIYPITAIDIAAAVLLSSGFQDNNRDRVIYLGVFVETKVSKQLRVTCVADADFDHFLGLSQPGTLLVRTDYTSLEMYCCTPEIVHKALLLFGCKTAKTGGEILKEITPTLRQLFLYRVTNHVLGLGLHWFDMFRCCELVNGCLAFDEVEFTKRYFNARGLASASQIEFIRRFDEYGAIKCADERLCICGHDFTEMLAWYFGKLINHPPHPDDKSIIRTLFASAHEAELRTEPFFVALLQRTEGCC